jgi:hypothetical protein
METVRNEAGAQGPRLSAGTVSQVIQLNHDALSTTNGLFTLVCAVGMMLVAYLVRTMQQRATAYTWVFDDMMQGPGLVLVLAAMLGFMTLALSWRYTGHQGRVFLFTSVFILVGLAAWCAVTTDIVKDGWNPAVLSASIEDIPGTLSNAPWIGIAVLFVLGVLSNFFTGRMRADRLNINTVAFISVMACPSSGSTSSSTCSRWFCARSTGTPQTSRRTSRARTIFLQWPACC